MGEPGEYFGEEGLIRGEAKFIVSNYVTNLIGGKPLLGESGE